MVFAYIKGMRHNTNNQTNKGENNMSYQKDRDEFIAVMTAEGMSLSLAQLLLRYGSTMQRLAVAQCNGDWPADNGERKVKTCPACEMNWVGSSFKKGLCPDCYTTQRVKELMPEGFKAITNGDPRGAVFIITVPSGRTNDWGRTGICVPSRER
jgi:hypothetical protein